MDGAGRIRKALQSLGARVHRGGQVLQRNKRTLLELKLMSDEARAGRGSRRPDAFSYGLWA